jgi:hypothetical protein
MPPAIEETRRYTPPPPAQPATGPTIQNPTAIPIYTPGTAAPAANLPSAGTDTIGRAPASGTLHTASPEPLPQAQPYTPPVTQQNPPV